MDAPITVFDSGLWFALVDYVTVYGRDILKMKFKDGTEIWATEQPQSVKISAVFFDSCDEKFTIVVYNIVDCCKNPKERERKEKIGQLK